MAVGALERLSANKLMVANQLATDMLLRGISIESDPVLHEDREQTVRFIDFEHPERDDFLVINQFRVDEPGGQRYIVSDIVLFVTTPYGYKPRASGMTPVCRPTPIVRFMHTSEQGSKQLMYRMARLWNTVAFLPLALRQRTHRNAMLLKTCKRTTYLFFLSGLSRPSSHTDYIV